MLKKGKKFDKTQVKPTIRMKLEIALLKLNETQQFEQILFWGKIEGELAMSNKPNV
mgnify:CR=1 FL=1